MAEERDPIFLNRYVQEDSDGGLSDEEAEMAAYLAAKSEAPITEAEWKNDKHALKLQVKDLQGPQTPAGPNHSIWFAQNPVHQPMRKMIFSVNSLCMRRCIGFSKLREGNVPYSRPSEYFAEMVKSDAHMEKVRQSLISEKKQLEASEERRKQRELKKFGKKVQTAKLMERAQEKKAHMDALKKWRKGSSGASEERGLMKQFPVELGGADSTLPQSAKRVAGKPSKKRLLKDQKYGFGGSKKHAKDNTAASVDDFTFDKRKNKELPNALKKKFGMKGSGPVKRIMKGGAGKKGAHQKGKKISRK